MGVFAFIERFFFISLALVFMLVVFLVYHFKNRITVAEKKNESMYGLLTAVVKEIKILRGMFGLGNNLPTSPVLTNNMNESPTNGIKSKTTQDVSADNIVPSEKEIITFEISASEENKVVVSDMEDTDLSDTESDTESDSYPDSESDYDSDEEREQNDAVKEENHISLGELNMETSTVLTDIVNVEDTVNVEDIVNVEDTVNVEDIVNVEDVVNAVEPDVNMTADNEVQEDISKSVEVQEVVQKNKPTPEQLRKMNINQLKSIASQIGIVEDISKMKKPELIALIQQK